MMGVSFGNAETRNRRILSGILSGEATDSRFVAGYFRGNRFAPMGACSRSAWSFF